MLVKTWCLILGLSLLSVSFLNCGKNDPKTETPLFSPASVRQVDKISVYQSLSISPELKTQIDVYFDHRAEALRIEFFQGGNLVGSMNAEQSDYNNLIKLMLALKIVDGAETAEETVGGGPPSLVVSRVGESFLYEGKVDFLSQSGRQVLVELDPLVDFVRLFTAQQP